VLERELHVLGDELVSGGAGDKCDVNHRRVYKGDKSSAYREEGSGKVQDQRDLFKNALLTQVGVHLVRVMTCSGPTLSK
jgi:hypothetical protein